MAQSTLQTSTPVERVEPIEKSIHKPKPAPNNPSFWTREHIEALLVVVTALAIATSMIFEKLEMPDWAIFTVNIISYLAGGYFGVREGLHSLLHKEINVDLLMVLAAGGAAIVNQWHEGAILLFLFSLSNVLQDYAMGRSRKAIQSLLDLRPDTATIRRDDRLVEVPVEELRHGDVVILQPGARVPVDGRVIRGTASVNQASITGESVPVLKQPGDEVFAGTINENGALDVEVTRLSSESTLSRIIQMVETAQDSKANTQTALDKFEQYYAMVVIGATLLLVFLPPLLTNVSFNDNFYRAMVVMVVASPCALVISTPASILSAIANGARHGVLFKGGAHLENMALIKVVAFDKTGTITTGRPIVTDIVVLNGLSENDLLKLTASAEARSEHPLANAVVKAAKERQLPLLEPEVFEAVPGRGIRVTIEGKDLLVGSERLFDEGKITIPEAVRQQQMAFYQDGKTALLIYQQPEHWLGIVAIADTPRPEAKQAIQALHQVGIVKIAMLTGDNSQVAVAIADKAGIDTPFANLMPEDKVTVLNELAAQYGPVAMVGDGVNDAPALATASLGIAMGAAGTDVALETADVVLMSSDLSKIAYAIALSKRARRIVIQNLVFSLSVIIVLVISALLPFVHLPLPLGVVGHEGSTVVVVLNGLRLLAFQPE
ncbi:MAG: cadmium-translocating P-type ATPase [Chloroflexi bacterium]|nr:cadmium-translocating P-type ATPase [Chloroflexota bacterium]